MAQHDCVVYFKTLSNPRQVHNPTYHNVLLRTTQDIHDALIVEFYGRYYFPEEEIFLFCDDGDNSIHRVGANHLIAGRSYYVFVSYRYKTYFKEIAIF